MMMWFSGGGRRVEASHRKIVENKTTKQSEQAERRDLLNETEYFAFVCCMYMAWWWYAAGWSLPSHPTSCWLCDKWQKMVWHWLVALNLNMEIRKMVWCAKVLGTWLGTCYTYNDNLLLKLNLYVRLAEAEGIEERDWMVSGILFGERRSALFSCRCDVMSRICNYTLGTERLRSSNAWYSVG